MNYLENLTTEQRQELRECIKEQHPELTDYEIGDDCDYF